MRWLNLAAFILLMSGCASTGSALASTSLAQASISLAQTAADSTAAPSVVLRKKSPRGAILRSLAVPGWGQYYNGKYFKAALAFAGEAALIGTAIYWNQQAAGTSDANAKFFYQNNRNTAYWFLLGTIVFSMLDAYVDASLSDFDESPSLSLKAPPDFAVVRLRISFKL